MRALGFALCAGIFLVYAVRGSPGHSFGNENDTEQYNVRAIESPTSLSAEEREFLGDVATLHPEWKASSLRVYTVEKQSQPLQRFVAPYDPNISEESTVRVRTSWVEQLQTTDFDGRSFTTTPRLVAVAMLVI